MVPLVAVTVAVYGELALAAVKLDVVIASAWLMTSVRLAFAVSLGLVESVTVTATVKVPAAAGVPEISPAGLIARPLGKPVAANE